MLHRDIAERIEKTTAEIARRAEADDEELFWGPITAAGRVVRMAENAEGRILAATVHRALAGVNWFEVRQNPSVHLDCADQSQVGFGHEITVQHVDPTFITGQRFCLDLLVRRKGERSATFLEIKRGKAAIGADHRAKRMQDYRMLEAHGPEFATHQFGVEILETRTFVLSYYGQTGFPGEMLITKDDVDDFFGRPIRREIEVHLEYFRWCMRRNLYDFSNFMGKKYNVENHANISRSAA